MKNLVVTSVLLLLFCMVTHTKANINPDNRKDCFGTCCVTGETGQWSACLFTDLRCPPEGCHFECPNGTYYMCGYYTYILSGCHYLGMDFSLEVGCLDLDSRTCGPESRPRDPCSDPDCTERDDCN